MSKTFDELFNEFFKRNNIKPQDNIDNIFNDQIERMLDMLANLKNGSDFEETFDTSLGKPDKIESFNEDNIFFERRIWNTPHGQIIKLIVSEDSTLGLEPVKEKTLQEKLDEAVEKEDYYKAIAIRDEINRRKNIENNSK